MPKRPTKPSPSAPKEIVAVPVIPESLAADDPFLGVRQHAANVRGGVKMTVAASLALGLDLNRLKVELGYTHGGASSSKTNLKPWTELVAEATGFSYDRCNRFMKTAAEVRKHLLASRRKGDSAAKTLVATPPASWNIGDYEVLATAVADHFEAGSFRDLMLETGILSPPKPKELEKEEGDRYAAHRDALNAHDRIAGPLHELVLAMEDRDRFLRDLHCLPLDHQEPDEAAGVPELIGAREIRPILVAMLAAVDRVLKERK